MRKFPSEQVRPDWIVQYSIYDDDLRVFDKEIRTKKSSELYKQDFVLFSLFYEKTNNRLLMIEIKDASQNIDPYIDDYSSNEIIEKVKEYANEKQYA
jgi:hypothetical protein